MWKATVAYVTDICTTKNSYYVRPTIQDVPVELQQVDRLSSSRAESLTLRLSARRSIN